MTTYYVYIISNWNHKVLYTGFTDDIENRTYGHKSRVYKPSFSDKYNCYKLLYYEEFETADEALCREKQLKRYRRKRKVNLINTMNPEWRDLYENFV